MKSLVILIALAAVPISGAQSSGTREPPESTIKPAASSIIAVATTQTSLSPVSDVRGKAFNKFYQIWLENTDLREAASDSSLKGLAKKGIALTNYWATTHPSEPNYCAAVAGDNFGMDNDDFHALPRNVSTIVDLLDSKGISWAEYQEDLPYPGFQGFNYSNQETFANAYVRKHNPLTLFTSVTQNATRLSLIKNFTGLQNDIIAKTLPQWAFITPNMTNDGHDTNIAFAAKWAFNFLQPLLDNPDFMNGTLLLLSFDESESYTAANRIYGLLLGGPSVIPDDLKGTTDDTFYNHYSSISSVSLNWGLPSLGRWDCEANVFEVVANETGYKNVAVDTSKLYFNSSFPGPLSSGKYLPRWPAPDISATCAAGLGVLPEIKQTWSGIRPSYNYTNVYPYDATGDNNEASPALGGGVNGNAPVGTTAYSGSSSISSTRSLAAGMDRISYCTLAFVFVPIASWYIK